MDSKIYFMTWVLGSAHAHDCRFARVGNLVVTCTGRFSFERKPPHPSAAAPGRTPPRAPCAQQTWRAWLSLALCPLLSNCSNNLAGSEAEQMLHRKPQSTMTAQTHALRTTTRDLHSDLKHRIDHHFWGIPKHRTYVIVSSF